MVTIEEILELTNRMVVKHWLEVDAAKCDADARKHVEGYPVTPWPWTGSRVILSPETYDRMTRGYEALE